MDEESSSPSAKANLDKKKIKVLKQALREARDAHKDLEQRLVQSNE